VETNALRATLDIFWDTSMGHVTLPVQLVNLITQVSAPPAWEASAILSTFALPALALVPENAQLPLLVTWLLHRRLLLPVPSEQWELSPLQLIQPQLVTQVLATELLLANTSARPARPSLILLEIVLPPLLGLQLLLPALLPPLEASEPSVLTLPPRRLLQAVMFPHALELWFSPLRLSDTPMFAQFAQLRGL